MYCKTKPFYRKVKMHTNNSLDLVGDSVNSKLRKLDKNLISDITDISCKLDEIPESNLTQLNFSGQIGDQISNSGHIYSPLDTNFTVNETSQTYLNVEDIEIEDNSIDKLSNSEDTNKETKLKQWAIRNHIPHKSLNELLLILRDTEVFRNLPKCARTFLGTARIVNGRKVHPGFYSHLGVQCSLNRFFELNKLKPPNLIEVAINIDGLPISGSSGSQFYPILCNVLGLDKNIQNVVLVGIYHGNRKPDSPNEFLEDFINECVNLSEHGVSILEKNYEFRLKFLLFDAVAKSSMLYVKGHSGYSSCTKCCQEGEYISDRICFPNMTFTKRSNENFRNHDENYHLGVTHFEKISYLDLVDDVPLDYMHLILLGVVKKLLSLTWVFGKPPHKLPNKDIVKMDELSAVMREYIPSEFVRRPRSVLECKRFKATELRMFLLYTGPVLLKFTICKKMYHHFLLLFVAVTILICPLQCDKYDYANELLVCFVKNTKEIYGVHYLSHNFHNLLHIVDDVKRFGPLDEFSNFSSENFLQKLKSVLRKGDRPLQQIVKRDSENTFYTDFSSKFKCVKNNITFKQERDTVFTFFPSPQYTQVSLKNFHLSNKKRDNCCGLKSGNIALTFCFSYLNEQPVALVKVYEYVSDFFNIPCSSSLIGVHFVKKLKNNYETVLIKDIVKKYVRFPYCDGFVVFPLLHVEKNE